MPKPRPFKRFRFDFTAVRLDAQAREKLTALAGLDPDDRRERPRALALLREVERDLSDEVSARNSVDKGPRAASQRARLDALLAAAQALETAINDLDQFSWLAIRDEADARLYVTPDAADDEEPTPPLALKELERAAKTARRGLGLRGNKSEEHRDLAIRYLAESFHAYAKPLGADDHRKAVLKFIRVALTAARMPAPKQDAKLWLLTQEGASRTKTTTSTGRGRGILPLT